MGRRNRSSSLGQGPPPAQHTASQRPKQPSDLEPCRALLERFAHAPDKEGRTAVHRAVEAASPSLNLFGDDGGEAERTRLDGLYLLGTLPARARELDRAASESGQSNNTGGGGDGGLGHLGRMMLSRDGESGYTPLHAAVVRRDLSSVLLLLDAASNPSSDEQTTGGSAGLSGAHPLRLLDGNVTSSDGSSDDVYGILNAVAGARDGEGLTPLGLLGASSRVGLGRTRDGLRYRNLTKYWGAAGSRGRSNSEVYGTRSRSGSGYATPVRGGRRRMVSFGNDADHDRLLEDSADSSERDRRSRSSSFNVDLDDLDDESHADESGGEDGGDVDSGEPLLLPWRQLGLH